MITSGAALSLLMSYVTNIASWYGRRQYHCPDALIVFSGIVVVASGGYGGGGRLRCMDGGRSLWASSSDIFVLVGYGGRRQISSDIANSIVGSTCSFLIRPRICFNIGQ